MLKKIVLTGCLAIIAYWPLTNAVSATLVHPNHYLLTNGKISIAYSSSSISGQPLLQYKDKQQTLSFQGNDIRSVETEIGFLVTITLKTIPDASTTKLTIILPHINLDNTPVDFDTKAIKSKHRDSFVGPPGIIGAIESYKTIDLTGRAEAVKF